MTDNQSVEANNAPGKARLGPGTLQWSADVWFGALIGGSAWLLLGSMLFASNSWSLAWAWAACGVITISSGVWLWSQRDRVRPYPALMGLLLAQWIMSTIAVIAMVVLGPRALRPFEAPTGFALAALFWFPLMMIQCSFLERGSKG